MKEIKFLTFQRLFVVPLLIFFFCTGSARQIDYASALSEDPETTDQYSTGEPAR